MLYVVAAVCTALMVLSLLLIFLSLPGNWLIIGLTALWGFFAQASFGWQFYVWVIGLAVFGEVVEYLAGHFGVKRYGGSGKGSLGGMVGAIAGGIFGAPFAFGLGALPGALAGGYLGCFLVEKMCGASAGAASRSAFGATIGRFGGFLVKLGIGIGILWLAVPRIWGGI